MTSNASGLSDKMLLQIGIIVSEVTVSEMITVPPFDGIQLFSDIRCH